MKLNPLRDTIDGNRLIVVDDSIVRGTTTKSMVAMLREAGAAEVHMRISSPPYRWPCHYGMATGTRGELLAANLTIPEIEDYLGVDSLAYLAHDRLIDATGAQNAGFCSACLTGEYPTPVPEEVPIELGRSRQRTGAATPAAPVTLGLFDDAEGELPAVTAQRRS